MIGVSKHKLVICCRPIYQHARFHITQHPLCRMQWLLAHPMGKPRQIIRYTCIYPEYKNLRRRKISKPRCRSMELHGQSGEHRSGRGLFERVASRACVREPVQPSAEEHLDRLDILLRARRPSTSPADVPLAGRASGTRRPIGVAVAGR